MSEKANNLWYYQQGGQKVGPVTATDLKKLAGAGKLKSDDQVRKEGMAEWVQASRIKGLFAMPAVVKCSVPIESDRSSTLKSENQARSARETASKPSKASTAPSAAEATPATTQPAKKHGSLADNFKKAAQTALKKSEQLKLTQVTLPSAYQALGKQVYTSGKARERYPELAGQIELLDRDIAAAKQTAATPTKETLSEKAKGAARKAKEMARAAALGHHRNGLLRQLGEMWHEAAGKEVAFSEFIKPIDEARARLAVLAEEIVALSQRTEGGLLLPPRILWAAVALVVLGSVGFIWFRGTRPPQPIVLSAARPCVPMWPA